MILDYFLRSGELKDNQKEHIKEYYDELVKEYLDTNGKFRKYTIKSIQNAFRDGSMVKYRDLDRLSREELVVIAMVLKSVMVKLSQKGIKPEVNQSRNNSEDW